MARKLVQRDRVGSTAVVLQRGNVSLHHIVFDSPSVVHVRSGSKSIRCADQEYVVKAGEFLALNAPAIFDVTNIPSSEGEYEALWLSFDASVIQSFHSTSRGSQRIETAKLLPFNQSAFYDSYLKAITGLQQSESIPEVVAVQRMKEVLAWIDALGFSFPAPTRISTADKIRRTISSAPHEKWTAPLLADRFAMSEATLRRKLSGEGVSFSGLLKEVRLSYALVLLQATDITVEEVAHRSGYENPSRFTQTFKQRFGHSPRQIRHGAD